MPISVFNDGNDWRVQRSDNNTNTDDTANNNNNNSIDNNTNIGNNTNNSSTRPRLNSSLSNVLQYVLRTQSPRAYDDQSRLYNSPHYNSINTLVRSGNVFRRRAFDDRDERQGDSEPWERNDSARERLNENDSDVRNNHNRNSRPNQSNPPNPNSPPNPNNPSNTNNPNNPNNPPNPTNIIRTGNIYRNLDYFCPIPRQTADEVYANLRSLRLRRSELVDQYRRSPGPIDSSNCVDKLSVIDSVLDFLKIEKGLDNESIHNLTCSWLRPGSKFTGNLQQPMCLSNRSNANINRLNEDSLSLQLTIGSIDYNKNTISGSIIISEPSIYFSVNQPIEEFWQGQILDPTEFCNDVIKLRQKERKEHVNWTGRAGSGSSSISFYMNSEATINFDKQYLNLSRLQGLSLFSIFSSDELIHHLEDPLFARKLRHRFVIMKWKTIEPEKHYFMLVWRGSGYIEGFVYEQAKDYQNQKINLCPERRGNMGFPSYQFV